MSLGRRPGGILRWCTRRTSAFEAKVTLDGETLWATFPGGSAYDGVAALALDSAGMAR